jgi:hypothetical protein
LNDQDRLDEAAATAVGLQRFDTPLAGARASLSEIVVAGVWN